MLNSCTDHVIIVIPVATPVMTPATLGLGLGNCPCSSYFHQCCLTFVSRLTPVMLPTVQYTTKNGPLLRCECDSATSLERHKKVRLVRETRLHSNCPAPGVKHIQSLSGSLIPACLSLSIKLPSICSCQFNLDRLWDLINKRHYKLKERNGLFRQS